MKSVGYIYCLSNAMYKGIYKVGFTQKNPHIRKEQLYTTGVLCEFTLEFAKKVKKYKETERYLHDILSSRGCRVNDKREFFKEDLTEIKKLFDDIEGEWFMNSHTIEYKINDNEIKDKDVKPLIYYRRNIELVKINEKKNDIILYKRNVNIS